MIKSTLIHITNIGVLPIYVSNILSTYKAATKLITCTRNLKSPKWEIAPVQTFFHLSKIPCMKGLKIRFSSPQCFPFLNWSYFQRFEKFRDEVSCWLAILSPRDFFLQTFSLSFMDLRCRAKRIKLFVEQSPTLVS